MVKDRVAVVSGQWVKKHRFVFITDDRGCRVVELEAETTHEQLLSLVLDDYGLHPWSHDIKLSYMFSNKTMKTMSHDTPPVYVSNDRQLKCFRSLWKTEQLRLCVEFTTKEAGKFGKNGSRERLKRPFIFHSKVDPRDEDYGGGFDGDEENYSGKEKFVNPSNHEDEEDDVDEEADDGEADDEEADDDEEDDDEEDEEFSSRFDFCVDSDGASSDDDDDLTSYGKAPQADEDSPTLPPKKRHQRNEMGGWKGNSEALRLEMSSLNLAVGQRYTSKKELEKRLKLLSVRDGFDFDIPVSNTTTVIAKCWVDGCRWRVRASTLGKSPPFYVRIYESKHTCSVTERSNRSRQATPDILGVLYRDFLGDVDPTVKARSVGVAINKHFGIKVLITIGL